MFLSTPVQSSFCLTGLGGGSGSWLKPKTHFSYRISIDFFIYINVSSFAMCPQDHFQKLKMIS